MTSAIAAGLAVFFGHMAQMASRADIKPSVAFVCSALSAISAAVAVGFH